MKNSNDSSAEVLTYDDIRYCLPAFVTLSERDLVRLGHLNPSPLPHVRRGVTRHSQPLWIRRSFERWVESRFSREPAILHGIKAKLNALPSQRAKQAKPT